MIRPRILRIELLEPKFVLSGYYSFYDDTSLLATTSISGVGPATSESTPIVVTSEEGDPLAAIKSRAHQTVFGSNSEIALRSTVENSEFRWHWPESSNTFNGVVHTAKAHLEALQTPVGVVANPQGGSAGASFLSHSGLLSPYSEGVVSIDYSALELGSRAHASVRIRVGRPVINQGIVYTTALEQELSQETGNVQWLITADARDSYNIFLEIVVRVSVSTGRNGATPAYSGSTHASMDVQLQIVGGPRPVVDGRIDSVTFLSNIPILPDPGTSLNFDGPHYTASGRQYPVLYAAMNAPVVSATFTLTQPVTGVYIVKGVSSGGFVFTAAASATGNSLSIANVIGQSSNPNGFGDTIQVFEDFAISWSLSVAGAGSVQAGTSHNTVYVSAAPPRTDAARYETVVREAVVRNVGHTARDADRTSIVSGTWTFFSAPLGDDKVLSYYGAGRLTPRRNTTTKDLLRDGDARCGAWARFFLDMLAVNGVTVEDETALLEADGLIKLSMPVNPLIFGFDRKLLIGNVSFPTIGTTNDEEYPYWGNEAWDDDYPSDFVRTSGIAGQNNPDPEVDIFDDHLVVQIGGEIYDPSYGTKSSSIADWEDKSLAGIASPQPLWRSLVGIIGIVRSNGFWVKPQRLHERDVSPSREGFPYLVPPPDLVAIKAEAILVDRPLGEGAKPTNMASTTRAPTRTAFWDELRGSPLSTVDLSWRNGHQRERVHMPARAVDAAMLDCREQWHLDLGSRSNNSGQEALKEDAGILGVQHKTAARVIAKQLKTEIMHWHERDVRGRVYD